MNFSDEQIQKIITDNCGNPPQIKHVEIQIKSNQQRLDFYTKSPFRKGQELINELDSYRRLITALNKILNELK
jgi:hypothetical protein